MNLNELTAVINNLNRTTGCFYGFETITFPHLTKKNRTTKEPTNFVVTIKASFSAMLGVDYTNIVREHSGNKEFVAQKPFGKHYVGDSRWLMESNKESGKYYIAVDRIGGMKKTIFINDVEATEEQIEDLRKNYFDKPSENKYGITWRTYGINGIISVR